MSPQRLLAWLCAALLASSALIFVSFGLLNDSSEQRVDASDNETQSLANGPFGDEPVVALSDTENRTILDLSGGPAPDGAEETTDVLTVDVGGVLEPAGPVTSAPTTTDAAPEAADGAQQDSTTASSAPTTATSESSAEYRSAPAPTAPNPTAAKPAASESVSSQSTAPATSAPTTSAPATSAPATSAPATSAPATSAPTTSEPTTSTTGAPATTQPRTEATSPAPQQASELDQIRNNDSKFSRFANVRSTELPVGQLLTPAERNDNGSHPDGTFRMACNYSHFAYDDPIVKPGQPGASHLHMFFGNTAVNANTTTDSLVNSGGGSCQGFELNRSGYWTPAVLDGRGNVVVPDQIILYYKSKKEHLVQAMPQGLKMVVGNTDRDSFEVGNRLGWSCGASGFSYNKSNRIPNNCGGDPVNFYVQFPQCWDGKNLDSHDHISHMYFIDEEQSCPSSHPVRLPQISILAYFPPGNTNGWHLSSDRTGSFNTGPGATLHADWFGGWNEEALNLWINNCMRASRNCSGGQTGTSRQFATLGSGDTYTGPNLLPLP